MPTPAEPPDSALADFTPIEHGRARALVRRGYGEHVGRLGLGGEPVPGESRVMGRAAHPVVRLPGGERVVVRAYRRGGLMARVNRDRYFLGERSFDELRTTEHARLAGVRVPVVVAAAHHPGLVGYRATLATLWIEGAVPLVEWLSGAAGRAEAVLRGAGREIAAMHDAGIDHPDLNLRNLLVAPGGVDGEAEVYLLDFDRARQLGERAGAAVRERNLRRLARSARKLRATIGAAGWAALREGYGGAWPEGLSLDDGPSPQQGNAAR